MGQKKCSLHSSCATCCFDYPHSSPFLTHTATDLFHNIHALQKNIFTEQQPKKKDTENVHSQSE